MAVFAQSVGNVSPGVESAQAWLRLAAAVVISTIGSVGMWSVVVALPAIQADFGIARADASLPYTMAMVGFALGGVVIGRLADRFGIVPPLVIGTLALGGGYLGSALAANVWQLALLHLFIGFGTSAGFAPLIADISHWFVRRRGIAVAVCASGNYLGGTVWPPVVQYFIAADGWRLTQVGIGLFCMLAMGPFIRVMRQHKTSNGADLSLGAEHGASGTLGLSPGALQLLLCIAGLTCCVAMSMPQVHIVAYCSDLGYGVARGAEMLSLMMGFGLVSRIASGFIADWVGGLRTLLLGSALQALALFLYLLSDGLTPLYVISALFGLFQGGIVPMYAVLVREYFPPQEAGTRLGLVIMATIVGMALGGWMSGAIFDLTGSYWQAFANGLLWNLVNISIVVFLLQRRTPRAVAGYVS
ncbi:MAG TPA: MFS transporter [Hyphomicrobiaceae bacterium]|nr:MFS transporter [Hyphomicrobiaceae bacterium]